MAPLPLALNRLPQVGNVIPDTLFRILDIGKNLPQLIRHFSQGAPALQQHPIDESSLGAVAVTQPVSARGGAAGVPWLWLL
jgi:hypothetical protein